MNDITDEQIIKAYLDTLPNPEQMALALKNEHRRNSFIDEMRHFIRNIHEVHPLVAENHKLRRQNSARFLVGWIAGLEAAAHAVEVQPIYSDCSMGANNELLAAKIRSLEPPNAG